MCVEFAVIFFLTTLERRQEDVLINQRFFSCVECVRGVDNAAILAIDALNASIANVNLSI